ncbi:hypothetical protein SOVF_124060, partial [Spinacia oleracea]
SLLHSIRRSLKYRKEGPSPPTSNEPRRKKGHGKKPRVSNKLEVDDDGSGGGGERLDNECDIKLLLNVLDELGLVPGLMHLGEFPDSLKSLVQTVAQIPVLGFDLCGNNSGNCKKLIILQSAAGSSRSLVLSLGLKDHSMGTVKAVVFAVIENRMW